MKQNKSSVIIINGYVNEVVGETTKGKMHEKIVRIYNKDKKALDRTKMTEYLKSIMAKKKANQAYNIRIYTDRGWRVIKKLANDDLNWLDEEEYLHNRKEGGQAPFQVVYFVDLYQNSNL